MSLWKAANYALSSHRNKFKVENSCVHLKYVEQFFSRVNILRFFAQIIRPPCFKLSDWSICPEVCNICNMHVIHASPSLSANISHWRLHNVQKSDLEYKKLKLFKYEWYHNLDQLIIIFIEEISILSNVSIDSCPHIYENLRPYVIIIAGHSCEQ